MLRTGSTRISSVLPGLRLYSTHIETVPLAYDLWEPRGQTTGAPIVFLHGLFGTKTNNRSVSRVLARELNCKVYCPDMRNHGESPHVKVHTYDAMAADVTRFIADHDIHRPILIGHSMGARAAMAVALREPNLVSKLIPVDNSPLSTALGSEFPRYVQGMQAVDRARPHSQKEAAEIMAKYAPELPIQQFLLANFKKNDDGEYASQIPLDILGKSLGYVSEFDYLPGKYRYSGPTLLIRGTRSRFVPDEALPLMGDLFPRFTVVDIEAGHWVISENPKGFLDATLRFLDDSD